MASINFVGNLTKDPALKYSKKASKPYVTMRVGENRRVRVDGQWTDGTTTFRNVIAYGAQAENIAESLTAGARVVVIGDERAREYTREGATEAETIVEVHADLVAPSLEYGTTEFTKVARSSAPEAAPEYDEADVPPVD